METKQNLYRIFKKSSTTFFGSSFFFPPSIRGKVATLYAFVRKADDFVDNVPQDKDGFYSYWEQLKQARKGGITNNPVIDSFIALESAEGFDPSWIDTFLTSMELDLYEQTYRTIQETEQYIYGSAEVVGLCLAKILCLPKKSYPYAELLGKSLQFVNFIRDIAEDQQLGRTYFPAEDLERFSLKALTWEEVQTHQKEFFQFIRFQLNRYRQWQEKAEQGFSYVPKHYLVPIKTASDLYLWTAQIIEKDPFIIYKKKVKPSYMRIITTGVKNIMFSG